MTIQVPVGGWIAILVVVLVALIGLSLFFGGWRHCFHGRLGRGSGGILAGVILLALVALVAGVGINLRSYHRLTYERPVATLAFARLAPQEFHVTLTESGGRAVTATLRGDEWELSARVLKWSGVANLLGFNALYHLDRLEGRYQSIDQERQDYHSVVDLSGSHGLDIWSFARAHAWLPWVDTSYGSAAYMPMADGAVYRVSLSQSGLVARAANAAAEKATAHW